jgi:hypothetical protein
VAATLTFFLGFILGVAGDYLRQRFITDPSREKQRKADERRQVLREMADIYDGALESVVFVAKAMQEDPETYTGPSVSSTWYSARLRIQTATYRWNLLWVFTVGEDSEYGTFVTGIDRQADSTQGCLDEGGWQTPECRDAMRDLTGRLVELREKLRRAAV